jgi:hypothetical protein
MAYTISDGATYFTNTNGTGLVPNGVVIPALSDGSGCCAFLVGGTKAPLTSPGRAKYNLTCVSHASDTTMTDGHTYSMPDAAEVRNAVGWVYGTDHVLYAATGAPKTVDGSVIRAFNNSFAYDWSDSKGLAIYSLANQTSATALKADKAMKLLPYNQPTAFFNGVDFTDKTSFDSGTPGSPGQWVLDNTGTLVNAGYDVPACQGFRLEWRPSGSELVGTSTATRYGTNIITDDGGGWFKCVYVDNTDGLYVRPGTSLVNGKKYRFIYSAKVDSGTSVDVRLLDGSVYAVGNIGVNTTTLQQFIFDFIAVIGIQPLLNLNNLSTGETAYLKLDSVQELLPYWVDTALDTTPIIASTSQPTRVSGTEKTGVDLGPELVTNGTFTGAVAGTPGTPPTSWSFNNNGGILGVSGGNLTFSVTTNRHNITQNIALAANSIYEFTVNIEPVSGTGQAGQYTWVLGLPSGATFAYYLDGVAIDATNVNAPVGVHTVRVRITVGSTSGNASIRLGTGCLSSSTASCIISAPVCKQFLPSFTNVYTPGTTFKRYNTGNTRPNVQMDAPGFLSEPARTNRCTCRKSNPVDTTNLVKGGDAASVLSVVDDTAALTAAGLIGVCSSGKVYKLDNSAGSAKSWVYSVGSTPDTAAYSYSAYIRGGTGLLEDSSWYPNTTVVFNASSSYVRVVKENTSGRLGTGLQVTANPGQTIYFILPQLEEGAFCTSPICKLQDGSDPLAAITRAATVATFPTAGMIRSNDIAFRMIVVPRQTGSFERLFRSTNTPASVNIYFTGTRAYFDITDASSVNSVASVAQNFTSGVPVEILITKASSGGKICCRDFSSGVWNSWKTPDSVSSDVMKANMVLGETYTIASPNTPAANISLFETLPLPVGLTDPLAWAKAQWGIS